MFTALSAPPLPPPTLCDTLLTNGAPGGEGVGGGSDLFNGEDSESTKSPIPEKEWGREAEQCVMDEKGKGWGEGGEFFVCFRPSLELA